MLGAKYDHYYNDLNLKQAELASLSEDERLAIVKKAFFKIALKYHPDKNHSPEAPEIYRIASEAYNILSGHEDADNKYVYTARAKKTFAIPASAFDLRMAAAFKDYQSDIISELSKLSEKQRQQAEEFYGDFIDLAESINIQDQVHFSHGQLDEQLRSFSKTFYFMWRKNMLRVLFQERLDDFTYRDMLANGLQWQYTSGIKVYFPIPIKWMAALTLTISSSIIAAYEYCMDNAFLKMYEYYYELQYQYHQYQKGMDVDWMSVGTKVATMGAFVFFLLSPYFQYIFLLYGAGIMLEKVSLIVATPINYVFRPLYQLAQKYPRATTAVLLSSILAATAVLALMTWVPAFAALMASINPYYVLAALFGVFDTAIQFALPYYFYKINPTMGGFFIGSTAANYLILLLVDYTILPAAYLAIVTNPALFFVTLGVDIGLVQALRVIMDPQAHQQSIFDRAPLPEEDIPQEIKDAALKGAPFTFWSNDLFNTGDPKRNRVIPESERDLGYQVRNFFGLGGEKKSVDVMRQGKLSEFDGEGFRPEPEQRLLGYGGKS